MRLALNGELVVAMSSPPGPPRKQWLDKIVDVVLGDDGSDSARFALICEKCFEHNGLVKESVWEDTRKFCLHSLAWCDSKTWPIEYVCPKCKHFNPSRRSKKLGLSPSSPLFPNSPNSNSSSQQQQSPSSVTSRSPVSLPQSLRARNGQRSQKSPLGNGGSNKEEEEDQSMMDVDGAEDED